MKILKRNGREVNFNPSKITKRIKDQSKGLKVDYDGISIKIISQLADGMSTRELDDLCVETSAMNVVDHPDYSILASRIFVTSLRKYTPDLFSSCVEILDSKTSQLGEEFVDYVSNNKDMLNGIIVQDRDFNHDIFGLKTLEKSYLLRDGDKNIVERPQYMWLRTAIEVTGYTLNLNELQETYDLLSKGYYTHATPTLFNSGTKLSQLSSCFLLSTKGDDIDGLFDTLKDCARISKLSGGIGLSVHNVRAKGSLIEGTNGQSDGLVPMFKTFNETARWINQGGKRKGSFAMYLEPWHADIFDFLEMKKNHGKEEMRARDLFYALWVNDLFMQRVKEDGDWSLFCPNVLKKQGIILQEEVGEEFNIRYQIAEDRGLAFKVVKARELWEKILVSQMETGTPYMVYKDKANLASNQKELGVIKSSNLCAEIIEYTSGDEQAVCNLASIALNKFVNPTIKWGYDFEKLGEVVKVAIKNLDNVIDANYYPTNETKNSNSKHRPVGLGVQGLADVYAMMRLPFDSQGASMINKMIFEQIYFSALEASCELSETKGEYSTFRGSPASKGILQFDMYDEDFEPSLLNLNWDNLKNNIKDKGLRNSLLLALMPTASTSQILGNNECFEPFTSNLYTRRTLAGEYIVVNKHLVKDLEEAGYWNHDVINQLKLNNGSVQNIAIPGYIKDIYKTSYEISQRHIINQASDRQRFICQSQSMNLFMSDPDFGKLSSMHMHSWNKGLKTGMYYLRSKPAVNATKFTVESTPKKSSVEEYRKMLEMSKRASQSEDEDCLMCGS
ncbi:ribonucleoside-diphosphate reductase subunit alpha [Crocosphaera sp.]|uniref:ribonucleoside-diphosphate reductase subunit alpha n=1 Tax=Crocosphaera sp. TaxID=2729996 RepID=UPI002580BFBC|nr:ribonucleoside-diphosphate reductase subunit alpha [Crocosphaera sp.]NQZ64929.1 ribonucleoside-diphosphate reductase subunit alpha [Crocosphaera sp.]